MQLVLGSTVTRNFEIFTWFNCKVRTQHCCARIFFLLSQDLMSLWLAGDALSKKSHEGFFPRERSLRRMTYTSEIRVASTFCNGSIFSANVTTTRRRYKDLRDPIRHYRIYLSGPCPFPFNKKIRKFGNGDKRYGIFLGKFPENPKIVIFWKANHSTEDS